VESMCSNIESARAGPGESSAFPGRAWERAIVVTLASWS
jgi:hypothetical protein